MAWPSPCVTGDFPIPQNTDDGPDALRNITPYLDLAATLGVDLLRIAMKTEEDIEFAQRAADEAGERNMKLAHQCHNSSLFEEVDVSLEIIERVGQVELRAHLRAGPISRSAARSTARTR